LDNYFLNAFLGLLLFSIVLWAVMYLLKKTGASKRYGSYKSKHMKSVDRLILSADKRLEIVQIGDTSYVLAVTQSGITVIDKLQKGTFVETVTDEDKTTFSDIIKSLQKKER